MQPEDIGLQDGANNTPGISRVITLMAMGDIKTYPAIKEIDPNATSGEFSDLASITTNIVMKEEKTPFQINGILKKGSVTSEAVGNLQGRQYRNSIKIFIAGNKTQVRGLLAWIKNRGMAIVSRDFDGDKFLLGTYDYPAQIVTATSGTGDAPESDRETALEFESYSPYPIPSFSGEIIISGSDSGSGDDSVYDPDVFHVD